MRWRHRSVTIATMELPVVVLKQLKAYWYTPFLIYSFLLLFFFFFATVYNFLDSLFASLEEMILSKRVLRTLVITTLFVTKDFAVK